MEGQEHGHKEKQLDKIKIIWPVSWSIQLIFTSNYLLYAGHLSLLIDIISTLQDDPLKKGNQSPH